MFFDFRKIKFLLNLILQANNIFTCERHVTNQERHHNKEKLQHSLICFCLPLWLFWSRMVRMQFRSNTDSNEGTHQNYSNRRSVQEQRIANLLVSCVVVVPAKYILLLVNEVTQISEAKQFAKEMASFRLKQKKIKGDPTWSIYVYNYERVHMQLNQLCYSQKAIKLLSMFLINEVI